MRFRHAGQLHVRATQLRYSGNSHLKRRHRRSPVSPQPPVMNLKINSERLRRSWPLLLIVAGTALLIYVGLQYVHMYREQHRLAKQFQEQQHALDGQGPLTHKVSAEEMLTRLYIPSIKLDG